MTDAMMDPMDHSMLDPTDHSMLDPGSDVPMTDAPSDATLADLISNTDPHSGGSHLGSDTYFGSSISTDAFGNEWKWYPDGSYEKLN